MSVTPLLLRIRPAALSPPGELPTSPLLVSMQGLKMSIEEKTKFEDGLPFDLEEAVVYPENPTTPPPVGGTALYALRDGRWYHGESRIPNGQVIAREITAAEAIEWFKARGQNQPTRLEPAYRFQRLVDCWIVQYGTERGVFQDCNGMAYLARLLSKPHESIPAIDLMRELGKVAQAGHSVREREEQDDVEEAWVQIGSSNQEILDTEATAEYRQRMQEAIDEMREAQEDQDEITVLQCREEIEWIQKELRNAYPKAGTPGALTGGDPQEKARVAVRQAIARAYRKLRQGQRPMTRLASYLAEHIETGSSCVYRPAPADREWET
jgi:hypothetical protein